MPPVTANTAVSCRLMEVFSSARENGPSWLDRHSEADFHELAAHRAESQRLSPPAIAGILQRSHRSEENEAQCLRQFDERAYFIAQERSGAHRHEEAAKKRQQRNAEADPQAGNSGQISRGRYSERAGGEQLPAFELPADPCIIATGRTR